MRAVADNFDPAEKHCAQNLKRLGQALAMYLNDYDDHFPLAYQRFSPSEPWQWDTPVAVPRNWQDGEPLWRLDMGGRTLLHHEQRGTGLQVVLLPRHPCPRNCRM